MRQPFLAIIDYGMGNLRSVQKAWQVAGADARLVDSPEQAANADALIFPGQGAIVDTMERLHSTGFDRLIWNWIDRDQPFFGICLGLQALFEFSEEGNTNGLGIFPGRVQRFRFEAEAGLKVPHMGWNTVQFRHHGGLPHSVDTALQQHFYFVHSYYAVPSDTSQIWASTSYGPLRFCSAFNRGRCYATQFHPEKSQSAGISLYRAFVDSL